MGPAALCPPAGERRGWGAGLARIGTLSPSHSLPDLFSPHPPLVPSLFPVLILSWVLHPSFISGAHSWQLLILDCTVLMLGQPDRDQQELIVKENTSYNNNSWCNKIASIMTLVPVDII